MIIRVQSIRAVSDLILRIIEIFLGIRFVTHFFSEDGFLAGLSGDIAGILEYFNFDEILPASSGIEKSLAFLVFILMFMLVGYNLIIFSSMSFPRKRESR